MNGPASRNRVHSVVLIPAYMPSRDLITLCEALVADGHAVVVVDDGSGADFSPVFDALPKGVVLITAQANQGKGVALKTGLRYILDHFSPKTVVVTADADGQHTPTDIHRVGVFAGEGEQSLVLGSRRFDGDVPLASQIGNTLTRHVFAATTGAHVDDTQTGLRAFSASLIPRLLEIPGEHYEYELNMLLWAAKSDVSIREIPIETIYIDDNASSHFNPLVDSIRIYADMIRFAISSIDD